MAAHRTRPAPREACRILTLPETYLPPRVVQRGTMQDYEALVGLLDEVHRAFADPEVGLVDGLDPAQRRRLQSRVELCLLDLQRQLSELILLESDAEFARRN